MVGGGSAALELGAFQLLVLAGAPLVPANVASFVIGLLASFVGYRLWSFAGDHTLPVGRQFVAYVALALFNLLASSTLIRLLVTAGLLPIVAKACCMGLIATWNYLLLNRLIFRRRPDPAATVPAPPQVAPEAAPAQSPSDVQSPSEPSPPAASTGR